MLFKDFSDRFLSICADNGNSAGELNQKHMSLKNHLVPFFGAMELDAIGIPEVRAYSKAKLSDGLAAKTINNHLLVLSRFFTIAREERLLAAPPFTVKTLPIDFTEARYLESGEVARLISAARNDADPKWATLILLGLHTGMRIGEMLALDWADVNLFSKTINVKHSLCRKSGIKTTKNKKTRNVTLTSQAHEALMSMPNKAGRVFNCVYETAYVAINRIADRAGLPDVGWHTLRHTFASILVMESVPLLTVSRLLGHSGTRITERYAHLTREKQTDAMDVLSVALGG